MLVIPEEIKSLFRQDNISKPTARLIRLRFYDSSVQLLFPEDTLFPSDELFPIDQEPIYIIDNSQIERESLTIARSLCEGELLTFGECNSGKLEITVADVPIDLTGKEFMATLEANGYELALGIFTVDSFIRQADRRKKKITAYDRMVKFRIDVAEWYQGISFPTTLKSFRDSLCEYVGITQLETNLPLDGMQISKTIAPKQLNGLDVLQAICEINGCFGQIDVTGRLRYVFLSSGSLFPSEELFPEDDLFPMDISDSENTETLSRYIQAETTYEDYLVYGIEKVIIRQEEGDVGAYYGDGTNAYTIQGNFLAYGKSDEELKTIAETIYNQISQKTYCPCQISTSALPWVEPGDGIICYTSDDVIETYCLNMTLSGIQAMKSTFGASGTQERTEDFGISTQIIQLEGKAAVIKKSVEEVSVRVTDLKNYTESQFRITAEQISAEVTRAKGAEETLSGRITVEADRITSEVANRQKADTELSSKITQTAESITLEVNKKVSKGDVTDQLNSELKITGNSIALTTGHFTINAKNMKLDSSGNAEFSGNVTAATINGGSMDIGPVSIDDDGAYLGDYYISSDGSNVFRSSDGTFEINMRENLGNGIKYPSITMESIARDNLVITNGQITGVYYLEAGYIDADKVNKSSRFYDIYLGRSWWGGDSITTTVRTLWEDFYETSDKTAKENIIQIDSDEALRFITNSNPITFQYKRDGRWSAGFIAQEVDELQDELEIYYPIVGLDKRSQKYWIEYRNYIPLLVAAMQNLQTQINEIRGAVE